MGSGIIIGPTDRCCFFGRTGSGKTTLARGLLATARRFAVLDPKHTYRDGDVPITKAFNRRLPRQIIRVPISKGEQTDWDAAISAVWEEGDIILYCDELTLLTGAQRISAALGRAVRTGRERGVGVYMGSQRPKDVPSAVFTESEHFFIFRLTFEADRDKVASFTTDDIGEKVAKLRGHECVYYSVLNDETRWLSPELAGTR